MPAVGEDPAQASPGAGPHAGAGLPSFSAAVQVPHGSGWLPAMLESGPDPRASCRSIAGLTADWFEQLLSAAPPAVLDYDGT
ncbi:hypothetical protein [Cupriavidus necator]|uniref:hypothetical protein n=1 Tax=Cupriavidus necator TaxID=106590 RepID=UPI00339D3AE2